MIGALTMLIFPIVGCSPKGNVITVAEVTHSLFYAPQYVAKNLGYFADEGLNIDFITTPGADKTMAALLSKDAQIGLMGPEATVYISEQGAKNYAVNFAKLTQKDGSFLLARDEIENFTWDMTKGKTIIGGRKGGMPEMVLEYILKTNGLDVRQDDPAAEVNVRTDVQFDVLAGVFQAGQSDFVALFEPAATQVVKNGVGHIVASLGESSGVVPYTAYSALKDTYAKNGEMIRKFTRAIQKGLDYCKSHDSADIATVVQKDFISSPLDEITSILDNYKRIGAWADDLLISRENFDKLLTILEMAGEIKDKTTIDYQKLVTADYLPD